MNCDVTLTAEEFKTIHNALCQMRTVHQSLQSVIREPILDKFSAAIRDMEKGFKGAYEQDNQAFDSKWNHYDSVKSDLGLRTSWSLYEVENLSQRHSFPDATYVVYDQHWGESGEVVKAINGSTWAALWVAADAAIRDSGDGHHCFIESFTPIEDKPGHLRLHTGS